MRKLAAVLLAFCSTSVFAAGVSDAVRKYRELRLGTQQAANVSVTIGHATFTSASAAVVLAGDQPVGLFLGNGTFTYELANKDEHAAVRYNAKHGDLKLQSSGDKLLVQEPFKSALVIGNGLPAANTTAATTGDWPAHRELFGRNDQATPPEHLFAYQQLDAPQSRLVRAEINASKPLVYLYDDALARMETLSYLRASEDRTSKFGSTLWERPLSRQAIGRSDRDAPPPRVRLVDVDVTLVGKMNEQGTLTVVETLVPQARPLHALHFDLEKYFYFDLNLPPRKFNLQKVTDGEGNALDFVHETDDLVVALAKPAPAGQPLKLTFEIDGDFLFRRDKTNFWELGIGPWFPWLQIHEQAYTFHSVVKVEKPFVAFASGKVIRRAEEGAFNVIETKLDQPVGWVAILAGKYQFDEEVRNGVNIRVASFVVKNKEAYRKLRNIAAAAIEFYPTFLGPFPFDEINIIEKGDFYGYGQAPAGIVFISSEAFTPKMGDANEFVEGVNRRFAHELAHAYWGTVVRMPSLSEQWLDEAFSEYSAALFMKAGKKLEYEKAFLRWKEEARKVNETGTIATANQLHHPGDPYGDLLTRQGLIYAKGAYLLTALHQELGDPLFLTFLKSYQKSFRWKFGSTKDIAGLLQFMTKKDYGAWLDANVYGSGFPEVKLQK